MAAVDSELAGTLQMYSNTVINSAISRVRRISTYATRSELHTAVSSLNDADRRTVMQYIAASPKKKKPPAQAAAQSADATLYNGVKASVMFGRFKIAEILKFTSEHLYLPYSEKRSLQQIFNKIASASNEIQRSIIDSASALPVSKKRRTVEPQRTSVPNDLCNLESADTHDSTDFPLMPTSEDILNAEKDYIEKTNNASLRQATCAVCARQVFHNDTAEVYVDNIPNGELLKPIRPHQSHSLFRGLLLYPDAVRGNGLMQICFECYDSLLNKHLPLNALNNNLWPGPIPFEIECLTLPEKLLIARYFPAAYIVKLYPKTKNAYTWGKDRLQNGLKGNVATFRLNPAEIAHLVKDKVMPAGPDILSHILSVTFIGPRGDPEKTLHGTFKVRAHKLRAALIWLKANNPLYHDIVISEEALSGYPSTEDGEVPSSILNNIRHTEDTSEIDREHGGYVPEVPDFPAGGVQNPFETEEDEVNEDRDSPANVIPLHPYGVLDTNMANVTETDIDRHAFTNMGTERFTSSTEFQIKRGSAFVNEYARIDEFGNRHDGGPDNPNHLLGTFPYLFPYGIGGFEVDRPRTISYPAQAKWSLQFADGRFRKDIRFLFQIFNVIQKRQVCMSANMQIKKSSFIRNENMIRSLTAKDLVQAGREEARKLKFSNPAVQALRNEIRSVRTKVDGTDESRANIRSKIWSMVTVKGAPSIWMTLNPADVQDPIAQVFAGEEIDMDDFCATAGPDADKRNRNLVNDPFAAAQFFHYVVKCALECLCGIKVERPAGKGRRITRKPGILGTVSGYIGTVESQGRGTLHLHILLWLSNAPSGEEMKRRLKEDTFRTKLAQYISLTVKADVNGARPSEILEIPKQTGLAYRRPINPDSPSYERDCKEFEKTAARTVQAHECSFERCYTFRNNQLVCKRRLPFDTSDKVWVDELGNWSPVRRYGYMNNWNPSILRTLACNHDIKFMTNGYETNDIGFYLTNYTTKKRAISHNTSALLGGRIEQHNRLETFSTDIQNRNKRLLQRCANTLTREQEFSAPEVVSYIMGWGDRYISHHFVPVFLDQIMRDLKQAFPTALNNGQSTNGPDGESDTTKNDYIRIEMRHDVLSIVDPKSDYGSRGHELDNTSYLNFQTDTYDGDPLDEEGNHALRSDRVPYTTPGRKSVRIVRQRPHETLPHFIGTWMPRGDLEQCREHHAAVMLYLLKPWRTLADLIAGFPSFHAALTVFLSRAPEPCHRFRENCHFFYSCRDRAVEVQSQRRTDVSFMDCEAEQIVLDEFGEPRNELQNITEEDIEKAHLASWSKGELLYGQAAVDIGNHAKLFDVDGASTTIPPPVCNTVDDSSFSQIAQWNRVLATHAYTKPLPQPQPPNSEPASPRNRRMAPSTVQPGVTNEPFRLVDSSHTADLNAEQKRAHDIIANHLTASMNNRSPRQLLMVVIGEGGTGKTKVIKAVRKTFAMNNVMEMLAVTATTGCAASLIKGQTVHSWGSIPIRGSNRGAKNKNQDAISKAGYLIIDEMSMLTKSNLVILSETTGDARVGIARSSDVAGGLNIIMFGDFHQFPPTAHPGAALYVDDPRDSEKGRLGRELFTQFQTVVKLVQQWRVEDPEWMAMLRRLRVGECSQEDLEMLSDLVINEDYDVENEDDPQGWRESTLITPRHSARVLWNSAVLRRYCKTHNQLLYISPSEDTRTPTDEPLNMTERLTVAHMKPSATGKLEPKVQLAIGAKVMVTMNIAVGAHIANGSRGTIKNLILDERDLHTSPDENGHVTLKYPPAAVIVELEDVEDGDVPQFPGLEKNHVAITPVRKAFYITSPAGKKIRIARRQYALTIAFGLTDIKSQGHTLGKVMVDLASPPRGGLDPFHVYVALSRSKGKQNIRLLRKFDRGLFLRHPSVHLLAEDSRLDALDRSTKLDFEQGRYSFI